VNYRCGSLCKALHSDPNQPVRNWKRRRSTFAFTRRRRPKRGGNQTAQPFGGRVQGTLGRHKAYELDRSRYPGIPPLGPCNLGPEQFGFRASQREVPTQSTSTALVRGQADTGQARIASPRLSSRPEARLLSWLGRSASDADRAGPKDRQGVVRTPPAAGDG